MKRNFENVCLLGIHLCAGIEDQDEKVVIFRLLTAERYCHAPGDLVVVHTYIV